MFLRCSYFLAKSEADVLINSVLIKRKACNPSFYIPTKDLKSLNVNENKYKSIEKICLHTSSVIPQEDALQHPACPTWHMRSP